MMQRVDPSVEITGTQVLSSLTKMNTDCAYCDQYSPKMLRGKSPTICQLPIAFSEAFAKLLSELVNSNPRDQQLFFEDPDNCLISYIKPIIKSSELNPTEATAYRPISVSHTLTVLI